MWVLLFAAPIYSAARFGYELHNAKGTDGAIALQFFLFSIVWYAVAIGLLYSGGIR